MNKFRAVTLLPLIWGAAVFLFSAGLCPARAVPPKDQAGLMQLSVSGLNPRDPMVPEFTLSLRTTGGLGALSAITAGINGEAGAVDRLVVNKDIPGLRSYTPELPAITRALPAGDYYLYVRMAGFETALDFSISQGKTTQVALVLSHIELRVPQCGFYNSESVEFQVFIPRGPPVYRAKIPCDSRRIITLAPGEYEGVVINDRQVHRIFPFTVEKGNITPVQLPFP